MYGHDNSTLARFKKKHTRGCIFICPNYSDCSVQRLRTYTQLPHNADYVKYNLEKYTTCGKMICREAIMLYYTRLRYVLEMGVKDDG